MSLMFSVGLVIFKNYNLLKVLILLELVTIHLVLPVAQKVFTLVMKQGKFQSLML